MLNLMNNVRVLVPSSRVSASIELRTVLHRALLDIGGVTITEGRGQWINPADGEVMTDHLLIYSFYYAQVAAETVCLHVYRIISKLLELGEASVAIEQSSKHGLVMSLFEDANEVSALLAKLEVRDATLH